ncbi:MAG TPA: TolC family protein [Bacteroidota bacterium]
MRRITILLIGWSFPLFGQVKEPLSIDRALAIGLEQSKVLKASSMNVEVSTAKASEASALLLPSLKLEGGYRRLSDVDPFRVVVPFSPSPITISPVVLDNYTFRLSVQQPLFTGFRLRSSVRAVERLAEAAQFDYRADEADLLLNIKTAYWLLSQTLEVKRFVDENVARLEMHVKDTENLLKAGAATRNDLLKIQVQLSTGKLAQIDADNDVRLVRMKLNNVLGLPLDRGFLLSSRPVAADTVQDRLGLNGGPEEQEGSVQALVNRALGLRPDLRSMDYMVEANKARLSAALGNWWPQVYLTGSYYYNRPNSRYLPTRDEFKASWDIGVQFQFDLWNWGATWNQADGARAQLRQAEYLYDQMRDNVALDVRNNYLQLQRNRKKIEVAEFAIAQSEENARSTNDKFKNGLATSSDLLDADVALLQSQTNLTGALIEFELSKARLERAVGGHE